MSEESKGPQETGENSSSAPDPERLEAIKAQLEEERAAKAAVEARLIEKDQRIAELEASLSEAKQGSEAAAAELTRAGEAHGHAVIKYLDAVRLANPAIPGDVIAGDTIEEIDASVAKAATIAESVKASLEARAKEARVPAGAPARGEISLEGLSAREKIAAGLKPSS
jgi:chromosome segregation ATPase